MTVPSIDLKTLKLLKGGHDAPPEVCFAEAVAWFAGEPHTDHPQCMSPVLGAYARSLNDRLPDAERQLLKPFIPRVVGTANDGLDEKRRLILANHVYRTLAPKWFRRAGLDEHAAAFEQLAEFQDMDDAREAWQLTSAARDAAWTKRRGRYDEIRRLVREELAKQGKFRPGRDTTRSLQKLRGGSKPGADADAGAVADAVAGAGAVAVAVAVAGAGAGAGADAGAVADAGAGAVAVAVAVAVAGADWDEVYDKSYAEAKRIFLERFRANPTVAGWMEESVRDAVELFDRLITADAA